MTFRQKQLAFVMPAEPCSHCFVLYLEFLQSLKELFANFKGIDSFGNEYAPRGFKLNRFAILLVYCLILELPRKWPSVPTPMLLCTQKCAHANVSPKQNRHNSM